MCTNTTIAFYQTEKIFSPMQQNLELHSNNIENTWWILFNKMLKPYLQACRLVCLDVGNIPEPLTDTYPGGMRETSKIYVFAIRPYLHANANLGVTNGLYMRQRLHVLDRCNQMWNITQTSSRHQGASSTATLNECYYNSTPWMHVK